MRTSISDYALFGGKSLFKAAKPTSGLYCPSKERFFSYAESLFTSRQLTNSGPLVKKLEERLAVMHGVENCITFCSGFMALLLAIQTLALPGRFEIVMPAVTYRRLAAIVEWVGLRPYFVDIGKDTLCAQPEAYKRAISSNTALLLCVHPIVSTAEVSSFENLSHESGIPLLIDSVEAAYGKIGGRCIGSFGEAEVFSMHASKFINGFEGGYITSNNIYLVEKLKSKRAFGFTQRDVISELGHNAKLNELHAAMSLASLDEIDTQIEHNKKIAHIYSDCLNNLPLSIVPYKSDEDRTWKNVVVNIHSEWSLSRDEILKILNAENILARSYYSPPLYESYNNFSKDEFPNANSVSSSFCVLPSGAHVSENDVLLISSMLHDIYKDRAELKNYMDRLC